MNRLSLITLALAVATSGSAQDKGPEIPYTNVPNPIRMPEGGPIGEVAGVATNSKGDIFVYVRSGTTRLVQFDKTGKFIREIGKDSYGFAFAHTVRIDKDDNIWVTDEGSNMVMVFDPEGKAVWRTFGRKPESVEGTQEPLPPGAPPRPSPFPNFAKAIFNRPTDVAWDSHGNLFVADGYNNSRVVKFDKNGDFVKAWGKRGAGPGEFHTVHTIQTDAADNVYVGDRENNRIQVFDNSGTLKNTITGIGAPWAICITPGPDQVLYTSDSDNGIIYKLSLDGKILGHFGSFGKLPGQFGWVHEISCSQPNTVYTADLLNWRIQKIVLK